MSRGVSGMMEKHWGRFTVYGTDAVEGTLRNLVETVGNAFEEALRPYRWRTVLLLGGYGRGEGGVECIEGKERPHNNLDFLVVLREGDARKVNQVKQKLDAVLESLRKVHGIAMDLAVTTESRLCKAPSLVMWYDMRFGHKTILGDDTFIKGLDHFQLDRIPSWDVRNLLVNRGTLLLINDELLQRRPPGVDVRKVVVKHIMKAIIGYGDA